MAPEDLTERHGAQTPRHTGPWGPTCTPAAGREVEDVFRPPQYSARLHARCSLRGETYTTDLQTLKEGGLSARPPLLWGDPWWVAEVIT